MHHDAGENEANVRYVLDKYSFMQLDPQHPVLGGKGLECSAHPLVNGDECSFWLSPEESTLVQRFSPCSDLDTIGFFIAKFKKLGRDQQP